MRTILCFFLFLAAAQAQGIKSVSYNVSNGVVVYSNTNSLTFTNVISFGTNSATTRANLGALATNGDAANLTNFPANLLRTNGSANGLTNFPSSVLLTNGNAVALTNFPANLLRTNGDGSGLSNIAVNAEDITGTVSLATNVTGTVAVTNGGTGATNAEDARNNLGISGITTNISWYDLDTNFHDLTISNGIITGYSQ